MRSGSAGAEKSSEGGEHALKIVQSPAGDKLIGSAPYTCFFSIIKEEIMSEYIFLVYRCGIGDSFHEGAFCRQISVKGEHILLRIVFITAVCLTIHVDGKVGDQNKIPVYIHKY